MPRKTNKQMESPAPAALANYAVASSSGSLPNGPVTGLSAVTEITRKPKAISATRSSPARHRAPTIVEAAPATPKRTPAKKTISKTETLTPPLRPVKAKKPKTATPVPVMLNVGVPDQVKKSREAPLPIEQITVRAYYHWLERGCPLGSPEEDWLAAEHDLRELTASA